VRRPRAPAACNWLAELDEEGHVGLFLRPLIAEWRVAATHTGLLALDEELALEPTGRRLELRGVLVAEFEGDRIRQFRQYWNEVELLDGLGLLPD
jgi:hypothetical protein